jgi:hypothetical protein
MRLRRTRLFIRENRQDGLYSVGYWDGKKTADPDRDFRSFGSNLTEQKALDLVQKIVSDKPKEFFYS